MIDTPGIMDTAPVSVLEKVKEKVTGLYSEKQREILRELYKVFVMSPDGLDAVIITIKYGGRFGLDDDEALKILNIHLTQGIKPKRSLPNSYRLQYFPKCGNFAKPKLKSWSSASEIPNTPIRPCVSSRRKLNKKYQHVVFKGN